MSFLQRDQPCFSISCCHLGPNIFFRISGSLTPMMRLPLFQWLSAKAIPEILSLGYRNCNPAITGYRIRNRQPSRGTASERQFGGSGPAIFLGNPPTCETAGRVAENSFCLCTRSTFRIALQPFKRKQHERTSRVLARHRGFAHDLY